MRLQVFGIALLGLLLSVGYFTADEQAPGANHDRPATRPQAVERIRPGDRLQIHVLGTQNTNDHALDIWGLFCVEPSGKVSLGPIYGRVAVSGLTLEEAETRVQKHLDKLGSSVIPGTPRTSITVPADVPSAGERRLEQQMRDLQTELRQLRDALDGLRRK